jgi:hypothetical protein
LIAPSKIKGHSLACAWSPVRLLRASTPRQMAARAGSEARAQNGAQPVDTSRGRKRKLESSPSAAQAGPSGDSGSAMPAQSSASASSEASLPRGQPLKDFVEQWEFRWDMQRKAYPWEWGSDGRLSDGPHNIIRCASQAMYSAQCIARNTVYLDLLHMQAHSIFHSAMQPK